VLILLYTFFAYLSRREGRAHKYKAAERNFPGFFVEVFLSDF